MSRLLVAVFMLALLAAPAHAEKRPPLASLRKAAAQYVEELGDSLAHPKDNPDTSIQGIAIYHEIPAATTTVQLIPTDDPLVDYLGKVTYMEYEYICAQGMTGLENCALSAKTRMTEFFAYEWGKWKTPGTK